MLMVNSHILCAMCVILCSSIDSHLTLPYRNIFNLWMQSENTKLIGTWQLVLLAQKFHQRVSVIDVPQVCYYCNLQPPKIKQHLNIIKAHPSKWCLENKVHVRQERLGGWEAYALPNQQPAIHQIRAPWWNMLIWHIRNAALWSKKTNSKGDVITHMHLFLGGRGDRKSVV